MLVPVPYPIYVRFGVPGNDIMVGYRQKTSATLSEEDMNTGIIPKQQAEAITQSRQTYSLFYSCS